MKKIKSNFSKLFITFIALFLSVINVKAVTITTNSTSGTVDTGSKYVTNKGNLIVNNVVNEDKFAAYKILETYYNSTTNVITYQFTSTFKAFLNSTTDYKTLTVEQYSDLTNGNITNGSVKTSSTLDKLVSKFASYIKKNSVTGTNMTVSGTTASLATEPGAYLVLPTETMKVYATMVGNIDFEADTDKVSWKLNNETIVAKVSNPGTISKSIDASGTTSKSFDIDEEFSFIVTSTVPTYPTNAVNKTYTVVDEMDQGITFSGISTVTIKDGETTLTNNNGTVKDSSGNTVGTISISVQKLTIEFNVDYITSNNLTITYKAKLNSDAVIGDDGNCNKVTLTYSNSPYDEAKSENKTTEESKSTAYTYGIEVLKYSDNDTSNTLEGAKFEIYSDEGLTTKVGELTTESNGIGTYKGLKEGTYYLKEVKAPTGHILLRQAKPIIVKSSGAVESSSNTGYYYIEISNTKALTLPFTGGMGTVVYGITGLIFIIIISKIYLFFRKKILVENK